MHGERGRIQKCPRVGVAVRAGSFSSTNRQERKRPAQSLKHGRRSGGSVGEPATAPGAPGPRSRAVPVLSGVPSLFCVRDCGAAPVPPSRRLTSQGFGPGSFGPVPAIERAREEDSCGTFHGPVSPQLRLGLWWGRWRRDEKEGLSNWLYFPLKILMGRSCLASRRNKASSFSLIFIPSKRKANFFSSDEMSS